MVDTPRAPRALTLFAAASGGIAIFMLAAALATTGDPSGFDRDILLALRNPEDLREPVGPAFLLPAARDVTTLAGTPVLTLFTFVLAGYFASKRQWRTMALLLFAVLGESILSNALKEFFGRPRPDIVPQLVHATSMSFPSGHSTSAAAIYLTVAALIARETKQRIVRNYVFFAAALLALLVGASRVYLGVHYPTDVIGGLSFGAAWAAIVLIADRRIKLET